VELADRSCGCIEADVEPMETVDAAELAELVPEWALSDDLLEREMEFDGFIEAMAFANEVARLATEEDHHPRICIDYDIVELSLTTHEIGGLSMNDFIMAAKIDRLLARS